MRALVLVTLLAAPAAHGLSLDLRIQASLTLLGAVPLDGEGFGGLEVHAAGSVHGIGMSAGLGWERYHSAGCEYDGGVLNFAIELRPLTFADRRTFKSVDPYIGLGFGLGGGALNGRGEFRGLAWTGIGIEFMKPVTLSIQYRFVYGQTPSPLPMHLLLVGIGGRGAG